MAMDRIKLFARRTFVDNIGLKALAMTITVLLFYFVREGGRESKTVTLDVELVVPKGVVQTNEIARRVEVTFVGPKVNIGSVTAESLGPLKVDLSPFGIGSSTYFFHKELFTEMPRGVSVTSVTPSYIAVRLEKEVSRVLPITPILRGQPAFGYRVDRYSLSHREATVVGPQSVVDRSDFLETEPIDIGAATKTVSQQVKIKLPAANTRLSLADTITVTVHIVEQILERVVEGVPVQLPAIEGLVADPREIAVRIKGPLRLVEKLTKEQLVAKVELGEPAPTKWPFKATVSVEGIPNEVARVGRLPVVQLNLERAPRKGRGGARRPPAGGGGGGDQPGGP